MHENSRSVASIQKALARVRALRQRRARDASGCFWIEGVRHFVQAFDARLEFDTIIHSRVLLKSDLVEMLARRLVSRGVQRIKVSPEQFRLVCAAAHASGIGAVVRQRWTPLNELRTGSQVFPIVVEDIRSPGNMGTILRTAEACGAGGVIFLGSAAHPFDPVTVRASMGGIFHLPLIRTDAGQLRQWAATNRVLLAGLSPDAERLWTDLPRSPIAIVIGEERKGLSERLRALCDLTVRLPMTGHADSLNVGVAAGVMMYEMVRRGCTAGTATPPPLTAAVIRPGRGFPCRR